MGDLSGGQVIKRKVVKAYGLDLESSDGVRFYEFRNLEGTGLGSIGDFKKIKEWYRVGMNAGTGDDEKLKGISFRTDRLKLGSNDKTAAILDEANKAFELNMNLFSLLKQPTSSPLPTNNSSIPLLGDPSSSSDEEQVLSPESRSKEIPVQIVQTTEPPERMVTLGGVLSVVVAVCLAHFLLVTMGLTGTAWLEKLDMMGWFAVDPE